MKILSALVLVLCISFSAFSHEKLSVTFCNKSITEVNLKSMLECGILSVNNPAYKVSSFSVGFVSGKDYKEATMTNNEISGKIVDLIISENPPVVYIENIILINQKGEKINAEPFKIKK